MTSTVEPRGSIGGTDVFRLLQTLGDRLYAVVDWFIPPKLKADSDVVQGVRMFLVSHLFGPFLGHTITFYILFLQRDADFTWWVLFAALTAFWPFSLVLRLTGWYVPLALFSIQNLIFCIFWGVYNYGGMSSPLLPWLVTVPLLAYFYLPTRKTRIQVSCLIVANLVAFWFIYEFLGFPEAVRLSELTGLGMVSTLCAGLYVSMMALYYANIVSSQAELEQEVQRHRETARQLQEATEQAERATRAKSEFLAKMSHELRTPLNAVIGYSEMLIEDAAASGQQFEDLQKINGAGKRLLDLVNDLLDLSKLEAGKMDVFSREFPLADLIDGVVAEWREKIAANGNEFRIDCPDQLGTVLGDETKLRQVVVNLLSNAAKFTKQGCVTLAAANRGGRLTISVRDTGVGIAQDQLVNLFETFGKGDDETSSKYGEDPGLGLPLSQRLCRLMEGELTVESELGRGSCFTLRLPSQLQGKTATTQQEIATVPSAQGERTVPRNSILVIDDDPAGLDLLDRILTKEGFSIVLSTNAVDGLMLARQMRPSIIILDIRMPGLNGWQVLQLIRDDPELRASRVVLLTVDDDFNKGQVLGADAHLLKPIDRDALLKCLERLRPVEIEGESLAVAGA